MGFLLRLLVLWALYRAVKWAWEYAKEDLYEFFQGGGE
jgi:hypothetical protein